MTAKKTLKKYFGYDSFRDGQKELIDGIMAERDVLGIMPTGAGKSICFQIPALMMDGVVIVVSPLISLMKDQVHALNQAGIGAAFINSSLSDRQIYKALQNAANGLYKLVYVAPERLMTNGFLYFATKTKIPMVVVDEAHCISQWGNDFRPSYAEIPAFVAQLAHRPIVSAFTATATPRVRDDIIEKLALNKPMVTISGFDRPNLHFSIIKIGNKTSALLNFLEQRPKDAVGIVYCSTRKAVDEVRFVLFNEGYEVGRYHAGMGDDERRQSQEDFIYDRIKIMVATNAFGMGIDKSNVSFVVHYNMPKDIESYYQEAGRAGRDGTPANCLLLYTGKDSSTIRYFIEETDAMSTLDFVTRQEIKRQNFRRLEEIEGLCLTKDCLRGYILRYFGENPPENCGNCANCGAEFDEADITIEAQKIISCVARMRERFGIKMVVEVLMGVSNQKIRNFGLTELSTFGISQLSAIKLTEIVNHLISKGYLRKSDEQFSLLKLGKNYKGALQKDAKITMKTKSEIETTHHTPASYYAQAKRETVNKDVFDALKALRLQIATENRLPAFVVFSDATLVDMCKKMPQNMEQMLTVSGVGQVKAERYGKAFLEVILRFDGHTNK
ncbi:MAG: DNA helicase RecQ [Defluviitaleaceae bacterium]|nr:DNA helicase RecQ [Defluviitaleaceae bacterium]